MRMMNLKRFFTRPAADAELAQELEAHLQHEVDDNLARGMNKDEAVRRARVKLGSVRRVREWKDIHSQLLTVVTEHKWKINTQPASYEQLHLSMLAGSA